MYKTQLNMHAIVSQNIKPQNSLKEIQVRLNISFHDEKVGNFSSFLSLHRAFFSTADSGKIFQHFWLIWVFCFEPFSDTDKHLKIQRIHQNNKRQRFS